MLLDSNCIYFDLKVEFVCQFFPHSWLCFWLFWVDYASLYSVKQAHSNRDDKLVTRKHLIEVIYQSRQLEFGDFAVFLANVSSCLLICQHAKCFYNRLYAVRGIEAELCFETLSLAAHFQSFSTVHLEILGHLHA